jgi:hypothetical protein
MSTRHSLLHCSSSLRKLCVLGRVSPCHSQPCLVWSTQFGRQVLNERTQYNRYWCSVEGCISSRSNIPVPTIWGPSFRMLASGAREESSKNNTTDEKEVQKFEKLANEWWDPHSTMRGLHALNKARMHFIREGLSAHRGLDASQAHVLRGINVLDVGCGGGILAESLARLGAHVTGIDVTERNIGVAQHHLQLDSLAPGSIECAPKLWHPTCVI